MSVAWCSRYRKFECRDCTFKTTNRITYNRHRLNHLYKTRFSCPDCTHTFGEKIVFELHQKTHDERFIPELMLQLQLCEQQQLEDEEAEEEEGGDKQEVEQKQQQQHEQPQKQQLQQVELEQQQQHHEHQKQQYQLEEEEYVPSIPDPAQIVQYGYFTEEYLASQAMSQQEAALTSCTPPASTSGRFTASPQVSELSLLPSLLNYERDLIPLPNEDGLEPGPGFEHENNNIGNKTPYRHSSSRRRSEPESRDSRKSRENYSSRSHSQSSKKSSRSQSYYRHSDKDRRKSYSPSSKYRNNDNNNDHNVPNKNHNGNDRWNRGQSRSTPTRSNSRGKLMSAFTRVKGTWKFQTRFPASPKTNANSRASPAPLLVLRRRPEPCALFNCRFPGCSYKCRTQSRFLDHQIKHSTERKFKCEYCDRSFKRKKELPRHIQRMHPHNYKVKSNNYQQQRRRSNNNNNSNFNHNYFNSDNKHNSNNNYNIDNKSNYYEDDNYYGNFKERASRSQSHSSSSRSHGRSRPRADPDQSRGQGHSGSKNSENRQYVRRYRR